MSAKLGTLPGTCPASANAPGLKLRAKVGGDQGADAHRGSGLELLSPAAGQSCPSDPPEQHLHLGRVGADAEGRGILFTILDAAGDNPRVAVLNSRDQSQIVLVPGAACAYYVDEGYLVYVASGTLFAVRFNLDRLRVEGDPLTLANGVLMGTGAGAYYAVSQDGTVAYVPETATPDPPRTLVWLDRQGAETPLDAPPRPYRTARLSPDGQRIALTINDQRRDVWTWDLQRQSLVQITSDGREDAMQHRYS